MDASLNHKLNYLRADYHGVVGHRFVHFFCPILFRDEKVDLCKAHIVNVAFSGTKRWTVQRKDVDNFFGYAFESDFVDIRHKGRSLDEYVTDHSLSKRVQPRFFADGRQIKHYVPKGPVPAKHSLFVMDGKSGPTEIALKIHPKDVLGLIKADWKIHVAKDLCIPAIVSMLKAAHLTLFDMLGYRYALSPGGHLLGRNVLGEFFLANAGRAKAEVLNNATPYFREFAHMVRPVVGGTVRLKGTAEDRMMYLCMSNGRTWSMIVFVRASQSLHAALVPVFQDQSGARRFTDFLHSRDERLEAHLAKFKDGCFLFSQQPVVLDWPKRGVLYPDS